MEESTRHEMVNIHLSQRFSSFFWGGGGLGGVHFFISFKYDFHVDAERMIVKTREM